MGSFTAINNNTDLQQLALYNEIITSINERLAVVNIIGYINPWTAGHDIQDSHWCYSDLQNWIASLVSASARKFLIVGTQGNPGSSLSSLEGMATSSIAQFTTVTSIWQMVNGYSMPRRRTTMTGYPSTGWLYGTCQAGDIIGPWLLQDLQLALRFLRFTLFQSTGAASHQTDNTDDNSCNLFNFGTLIYAHGAASDVAGAVSDYNYHAPGWTVQGSSSFLARRVMASITSNTSYHNHIYDVSNKGTVSLSALTLRSKKLYLYGVTQTPTQIAGGIMTYRNFDANIPTTANKLTNIYADGSYNTQAAYSVPVVPSTAFDATCPLTITPSGLSGIIWYGWQLSSGIYGVYDWAWSYA